MSAVAEMRKVVRSLVDMGYVVEQRPNGHYRVTGRDGAHAQLPKSPRRVQPLRDYLRHLEKKGVRA